MAAPADVKERRLRSTDESYISLHAMRGEAIGKKQFAGPTPSFRRTPRDAQPPRKVVTADLLGDPWPGRPSTPEEIITYNERVTAGEFTPPLRGIALRWGLRL